MRSLLIVNADDLGYSTHRDEAIFRCFQQGCVTSASLMVNGQTSAQAAKRAVELGLPLGLHLNLTEFSPVSPTGLVPSLLLKDGGDSFMGKFGIREHAAQLLPQELECEISAQIDKFIHLCGGGRLLPTHVDGHQHVHVLPKVRQVFARTLHKYGITRTRLPSQPVVHAQSSPFLDLVVQQAEDSRAVFQEWGVMFPTHFIGLDLSFACTLEKVWSALAQVPRGGGGEQNVVVEWMCHPGLPKLAVQEEEDDSFSLSSCRENEVNLLTDGRLRGIIEDEEGYVLGSFRDLSDAARVCETVHTVMILSSLTPWTGNQSTALRLRAHVLAMGSEWRAVMVNANALSAEGSQVLLQRIAQYYGVDVAIGLHALRAGGLLLVEEEEQRMPYIIVLGGTDMNESLSPPQALVVQRALTRASAVVAFNPALAARASAIMCSSNDKIHIIPQSVLLSSSSASHSPATTTATSAYPHLMVLPLGVRAVKDPLYVLDVIQRDLSQDGVRLVICGPDLDAELTNELQRRIAAQRNNIAYIGPVVRSELLRMMRTSTFVINSSVSEGQSSTLLEAMSTGTALVLARNNDGNRSVVRHGETGYLFNTPEEFVRLVRSALADEQGRLRMVRNAAAAASTTTGNIEQERQAYGRLLRQALL